MGKKAYRIQKEGDFYVIPAGYAGGRFHEKIRTMNKDQSEDIIRARKSVSLKRKYPEVRCGVRGMKNERPVQINWDLQQVKVIPDYLTAGKYIFKLQGLPSTEQVAKANESYYKYHGHETFILKTRDGRYVLYVSEEKR